MNRIKRWIYALAERIVMAEKDSRGRLGEDYYITAMSKAYQNPAILQYLDGREEQLEKLTVEAFITNQAENANRTAGRLVEIRALRARMRVCFKFKQKGVDKNKRQNNA